MPRLSEARRQDRHDLLLDAATIQFAEKGYDATSISGIARAAGVSDGLIYRYFDDKRALLSAVLERLFERIIERTVSAVHAVTGIERRLEQFIASQLSIFQEEPDLCRLYIRELRNSGNFRGSPLFHMTKRYTDLLVHVVEEAVASGEVEADTDPRMLRDVIFGGIEHIALHLLVGGQPLEVPQTSKRLAHMFVRGIGKR
ncbi:MULTISPECIES: TetR/AcrR family transcriptional regulator [Sphingomonadales]|uniref:TetR/AcrR family transcriptional regulator n=2 Tax=Edaphosphingomonas TaxID=3423724 RepID=A0A2T4HR18_9SPHN|nr:MULTISPECIES: TetR/AcrR family transcriptional regulator [Sphingomonas]AGH48474.1 TetR family transcriptional regulator [Sphingomonas sp. MM-1]MDX3883345.1 TetR/AcrR family transcriptional regulator [Sphingomonas sp.]OHT20951.1 Fatty acid metabolism regulator protein [Sphingomonas haloaromaticamans]PTD18261.1 TetR/AcrR family transcriptional regulator [Sphingomonas fennica]